MPSDSEDNDVNLMNESQEIATEVLTGNNELNDTDEKIIINELLTYISYYLNNSNIENIKKITINFYSTEDIISAKKLLWNLCSSDLNPYVERKNSDRRTCTEASLDDIFKALVQLDMASKLPLFAAKNVERIPDRQLEELNLLRIIDRLNQLERNMNVCNDAMVSHDNEIKQIKVNLSNRVDYINDEILKIKKLENFQTMKFTEKNLDIMNYVPNDTLGRINNNSQVSNELQCNEDTANLGENQQMMPIDKNNSSKNTNLYTNATTGVNEKVMNEPQNNGIEHNNEDDITLNEIKTRLQKLRNFDNESNIENQNNETFSNDGFMQFLDKCEVNDVKSLSMNEFQKNRLSCGQVTQLTEGDVGENLRKECIIYNKNKLNNGFKATVDEDGFTLVGVPVPVAHIWVYRVQNGNDEVIKRHIEAKNIGVKHVIKKSNINAKYKSYKVTIKKSDLNSVLNRHFWPEGVLCKVWKEYNHKNKINSVSFVRKNYNSQSARV